MAGGVGRCVMRWWRGKGHGVHSPFAYRFIRSVLRERGSYYASTELSRMADPKWCGLLFRLVCEFEPVSVVSPSFTGEERRTIALADSRVAFGIGGREGCLSLECGSMTVTVVRDVCASGPLWEEMKGEMRHGMAFTDGRRVVLVPRPDLPRQDFETAFA